MLGDLPKEPEWARGLTEAETNPATAFYGKTDVPAELPYCAAKGFLVSFKH